jgi:Trk-type K+ transport system membrane component
MLGLNDIQYLYEFLFWFTNFFILKKVWHKPEIRLIYGYSVALFNLLAVFFFSLSSIKGKMNALDAFAFGFLHAMVAIVMITLVQLSKRIDKKA